MRISFLTLVTASLIIAGCNRDQDKLDENAIAEASGESASGASDKRCTSGASHEAVKRELFRRAAEVRGSNAREFEQVAGYALLLVEAAAPVEAAGERQAVDCRGRAKLSLPPGLKVAGGRTSLSADIGFNVAPGGAVTLGEADGIIVPLATLSKAARAAPAPPPSAPVPMPAPAIASDPLAPRPEARAAAPPPARAVTSNPSFNCARARTRSEIAVCANPSLGALDRSMSAQYSAALGGASPGTAALLRRTRDDFLGYRERCASDACIATTYRGRMREIADIAAGRWQGR